MKRFLAFLLTLIMLFTQVTVVAADGYDELAELTDIDLSVFKAAGYICEYNEMKMTATFTPPDKQIGLTISGSRAETYAINMDVVMMYTPEAGLVFLPRLVLTRLIDRRNLMEDAYIKVGNNRYRINFSDPQGGKYSSSLYINMAVEVMGDTGIAMMQDMVTSGKDVKISMGDSKETTLWSSGITKMKNFYDTCKKAGILDTAYTMLYPENYEIVALLNK